MHKIHLEEDVKPSREPQRRLNPAMEEVVRAEVIKLFDASIIYPISNSKCDGDQGTALKDLVQVPIGPGTRARAKKFKDVLNGLIQELWAQANSWRPIEHDPRGQQRIVTLIQVLE
jgi:hypothetical protein